MSSWRKLARLTRSMSPRHSARLQSEWGTRSVLRRPVRPSNFQTSIESVRCAPGRAGDLCGRARRDLPPHQLVAVWLSARHDAGARCHQERSHHLRTRELQRHQYDTELPLALTRATPATRGVARSEKSIITLLRQAGFETFWISNQERSDVLLNPISQIAREADHASFPADIHPRSEGTALIRICPAG